MVIPAIDPERKRTLAQYRLTVNGSAMTPELERAVISVTVDERLHVPMMFEIQIGIDPNNMKWLDEPVISEGKEVEIFVGYTDQEQSLCIGKVTSLEVDLDETMPVLVARGYDLSFALHRDVKNRSFLRQTDGDIAKTIAGESGGLTAKVDATSEVHPYLLQHSQTNYDFLLARAHRIGYELRVVGRELQFKKPTQEGTPVELNWGVNLKRFNPRLSVADQVDEVEVRGWDPTNKQAIIGSATTAQTTAKVGETRTAKSVANGVWGEAKRVVSDAPVTTEQEAKSLAQSLLDEMTSSFIQATGECNGDPKLRVGAAIDIKGIGTRFGGSYYLTAVRHSISKQSGHQVAFTVGSQRPATVTSLLLPQTGQQPQAPHVMVGVVTNNDDPDKLARVKVKLPTLFDNDESHWARIASPMAGKERGWLTLPEVNDEVLVAFEHGDPNHPYVLGGLWNGTELPPEGTKPVIEGGVVNQRLWRSRTGHLFMFDDTDGSEAIRIIDKTGTNHITITSSDNKLVVELDGDIEIKSLTGQISMTAQKDIKIESQTGKVSLKGVDAILDASKSASMKSGTSFDVQAGTSFAAKASTSAELNGSVSAKLEGGIANVQGSSATNIKGGVVNIN